MQPVLSSLAAPELVAWTDELVAIRREIHAQPELGFETDRTVERIARLLRSWGLEHVDTETVPHGVIAVVEGDRPGKTVALRADIDALPMNDCSDNPWKSTVAGRCHACGHDGHQTWLMAALRYLNLRRDFPGRVVGIFQPNEEGGCGAKHVIACGVFEKFGIAEIYGAHTEPMLPKGVFGFKTGPLQAASDFFTVTVHGVGTHGGRPHFGVDPIPVAAQIISAVQTIVSRKINPIHPATVSVCSVNAGQLTTYNVVPHFATLGGTARMFDPADRDLIEEQLGRMVRGIAEANGCTADFEYIRLIGPVINGKEQTEAGMAAAARLFGEESVRVIEPFTSSEDFAEYLELAPGSMLRVGVRDEAHQASVHNQAFDFNDEVLPAAATLLAAVARDRLEALA